MKVGKLSYKLLSTITSNFCFYFKNVLLSRVEGSCIRQECPRVQIFSGCSFGSTPPLVHGSFYFMAKLRITISAPPLNLAFRKQLPSTAGGVNPPFVATLRSAARTSPLGDCLSDWADALGVLLHVPRRMGADKSFTGRLLRTTALAGFRNVHRKFLSAFAKRVQFNE